MKGIGEGPKGEYRFCGGIVKGIDIEGFLGIEEADEMVFYTLHFFLGDFIGEDVGGAVDLHGVAIDDLAVQGFGKVDAELGLADSSCTCALEAIEKEGKQVPTIAHRVFLAIDVSIRHQRCHSADPSLEILLQWVKSTRQACSNFPYAGYTNPTD
jgi:hypothetical protein